MIAFGGKQEQFAPQQFYTLASAAPLLAEPPFVALKEQAPLRSLHTLRQVHGIEGHALTNAQDIHAVGAYRLEGDYLMTTMPGVGLAVATADCLPVILYDGVHHAIALIHAGWRGSMAGITRKALEHMQKLFNTEPSALRVFFGPAARDCCYEVSQDFAGGLPRGERYYFDLVEHERRLLQTMGVLKEHITDTYARCTICSHEFCSYRRDKECAGRQMTVVCLK